MEENNIDIELNDNTPDPAVVKPYMVALKGGLIMGAAIIVFGGLADLVGMDGRGGIGYLLKIVLFVLALIFTVRNHRDKELDGFISFGRVLGTAMIVTVVGGLLISTMEYINVSMLTPDQIEEIVDKSVRQYEEMFDLSEDKLDQMEETVRATTGRPMIAARGIFINLNILGLIVGLILGASMKRNYQV